MGRRTGRPRRDGPPRGRATVLLNATFAALADPTRRSVIERLTAGEATVTELAKPFDMSLPAVSKHLTVLEEAGLIVRTREGRTHRCRLVASRLRTAAEWAQAHADFWESQMDRLGAFLEEEEGKA